MLDYKENPQRVNFQAVSSISHLFLGQVQSFPEFYQHLPLQEMTARNQKIVRHTCETTSR